MRSVVRVLLVVVMVAAAAAPAAAQDHALAGREDTVAAVGHPGRLPTLDPASLYTPGSARQSVLAAIQEVGTPLARMRIPAIDLDETMYAGVALSVLAAGPGHWVGTAMPGELGNMVIAGHRTTYTAPFGDLDRLVPGDMLYFERPGSVDAMYAVTETIIVNPDDIWITFETGEAITTLFACHPRGSAAKRIVVRARLVGEGRIT